MLKSLHFHYNCGGDGGGGGGDGGNGGNGGNEIKVGDLCIDRGRKERKIPLRGLNFDEELSCFGTKFDFFDFCLPGFFFFFFFFFFFNVR